MIQDNGEVIYSTFDERKFCYWLIYQVQFWTEYLKYMGNKEDNMMTQVRNQNPIK